ncbi:MAG: hypoxanthine phosphoribosyltransferase [Candidatus Marinimicrobia bacterium]|nr:hypoxanthine phosphoribosyltransferase [Candidatus Neomarinimicrobiota bacterium]|tara:strand:+ start:1553 stop:2062 length:510 start_codon:yes stop_codon:yes gene_type:complete
MKEYLNEKKIKERVEILGEAITKAYKNQNELTILCVLKGSFIFLADLVREIELDLSIEFIDVSSYVGMSRSELVLNKDINFNVKNKNILIVEDIIDSGNTINFLFKYINDKKPKSLKIATLFFKPEAYNFNMKIDWIGFNISNEFIVGYGLDLNEIHRNKKSIYILEDE